MVGVRSRRDWTDSLHRYSAHRTRALGTAGMSGFVFKANSPSCGLAGVEIHDGLGAAARTGVGLFAAALRTRIPDLPVGEESQLTDPGDREDFISRVYAYWRRLHPGNNP